MEDTFAKSSKTYKRRVIHIACAVKNYGVFYSDFVILIEKNLIMIQTMQFGLI